MAEDSWEKLYKDFEGFFCAYRISCDACPPYDENAWKNTKSLRVIYGCPIERFVNRRRELEEGGER